MALVQRVYAERVVFHDGTSELAPGITLHKVLGLLSQCWDVPSADGAPAPGAGLADALAVIERGPKRRGLVVVISDFLDRGWERPLTRLAFGHDVVAVQVVDPRERELPDVGVLAVVDPESGRLLDIPTGSSRVRDRYAAAARARQDAIATAINGSGADHVVLATDRDWVLDLAHFVARRRRTGRPPSSRPGRNGTRPLRSVR